MSRSSGGQAPAFGFPSAASRREFSSQGGNRPGQTADSGELGAESGWHVVDSRHGRSGRSWPKLFKQLIKLLDDIYLTCELDCSLAHVATMVEYLEVSAGDFAELHSQLESVVSPSGQKVAWEVRATRRASNRSPRIGSTPFASSAGGGIGGGGGSRAQGHVNAGALAAAAAAADAAAGGLGPGSGTGQAAAAEAAAAAAEAAAAAAAAYGNLVAPSALARASALLGMRRAASCGGAPPVADSGREIEGLPPPRGGFGASEGGAAPAAGGPGSGAAPRPPGSSPGPAPGPGGPGPPSASSAGSAADGNPWKGKVNWHELFGRPHALQQQQQQKQLQARPGTPQAGRQAGSGAASSSSAAAAAAAAGSGTAGGPDDDFRLGNAPPPPRLKTKPASGGGGGGGGSGGGGSGTGSSSPTGGPPSPLDSLYHKMLSSPSRKLSPSEVRRASEERHARAEKARQAMVEEKLARLAQANQSRQTVKSIMEERAGAMAARVDSKIARSAELRQAHLAERVQKAVEETKKVAEVAFINQMLEQDKKLALQEKLEEGESRRRQALEALQQRGKGAAAAVEEAQERRKLLEAERREKLVDLQRRKMAVQAKLEEERRAAAAAREAASRAQRAAAAQAAEARQRLRDVQSVRIEERLREAAARRAQHLELIKERAALGKDLYDRRTMDGASPRSPQSRYTRPPSPEVASAAAGGSNQAQPPPPLGRPSTPPGGGGAAAAGAAPRAWQGGAGSAAGAIASAASAASASAQPPPSSPSGLHSVSSHSGAWSFAPDGAGGGGGSCSPIRSSDRSITLSGDPRRRLKGMRRRACKTLKRLEEARPDYTEPPHLLALMEGPDGQELVAAWKQLVEAARRDTAATAAADAAAAAASKAARRKAAAEGAAVAAAAAAAAPAPAAAAASGGGIDGVAVVRSRGGGNGAAGVCGKGAAGGSTSSSIGGAASAAAARSPEAAAAAASVKHLLQRVHTDLGGRSKGIALHAARPSGLLAALVELLTAPAAAATSHPPQTSVQLMELLALLVTSSPHNAAWLLARCGGGQQGLAGLVRCAMRALDRYNGLAADEVWEEPPEARYLAALLQTLACLCRTPFAGQPSLHAQQEELVAYVVACGLIHKSTELFSLFDQPAANDTAPIPGYVLQCLALLETITGGPRRRSPAAGLTGHKRWLPQAANGAAIALAFQETSMAGLPSLLTAVLLRAAPSCTPAEARPERLPPNFVEAAACVMRVLNNIARLDLIAAQSSLGASDLRVVFFHLVGFLLSYCTNQWPTGRGVEPAIRAALNAAAAAGGGGAAAAAPGSASPAVRPASSGSGAAAAREPPSAAGAPPPPTALVAAAPPATTGLVQLLNEVLLLIGFYGVLQPANQDVLLWGKSPTILQRLAEVPFPYFVEQQLYQVLMPTLLSVCYGSERACATLAQHMDLHLLQSYVQTMIRQFHSTSPSSTPTNDVATRQGPEHAQDQVQGLARPTHGSPDSASSSPTQGTASPEAAAASGAGPAAGSGPLSPRRQLLQDLPSAVPGMPGAGGTSSGGSGGCSKAGAQAGSAGGAAPNAAADDDALSLPPPTADRYSLPQRFPPGMLPQVLAFLERQMPGAADHAGSAESSLAAAVAAAAAAGRLTAAPPQLSSSPLAVLAVDGQDKKVTAAAAAKRDVAAAAPPPSSSCGGGSGGGPPAEPAGPNAAAAVAAAAGVRAAEVQADGDAQEAADPPAGPPVAEAAKAADAEETHGTFSTPVSKAGAAAAHHASGSVATDSPSLSGGAGAPGTGSSGRAASSSGSYGYSHHHFRRFLDAAEVPVPFAAGGVRRHRLLEAAAALAAVAEGGGGGGSASASGGCGSAGDANNCARSYVSELSFAGAYLTPSLQGDSREGDPRSPGEDERIVLDEFDLEQYEQQRLDEQQHLDEQDVLLLDEPPAAEGGVGGRRGRVAASSAAAAAVAARRKSAASRSGGGSGEDHGGGSPPDLGAGLLTAVEMVTGRADRGVEESRSLAEPNYEVPASTGVVMDAWWRRIGYEFGGVDASSDAEESAIAKEGVEDDGEEASDAQAS
ncbi:hypothetical protein PLESTF_001012900 [Pleodorina starrii]|nr:hypothetical protein PLESTM_001088200 [Pleodorina starrii]GLC70600.1 hypothetical protein PLESTF_001012900 [Pleodorina starrii]